MTALSVVWLQYLVYLGNYSTYDIIKENLLQYTPKTAT